MTDSKHFWRDHVVSPVQQGLTCLLLPRVVRRMAARSAVATTLILLVACGSAGERAATPTQLPPITAQPGASSVPATWASLRWSQPSAIPDDGAILDVASWRGGFVAVGEAIDGGQRVGAAFTSADGTRWQRSTSTFRSTPGRVVATAARLIALAPQLGASAISDAWVSTDGRGWRREETMALPVTAISVAAREETIIAAGIDASGQPTVWRSSDGSPWTQGTGMSKQAIIRNVTAVRDGFVAVGREGEPDTASGGVGVPGRGRPAAWWSADGREWTKLTVEGADASGAQLLSVFGMTGGYLAVGSDTLTASGSPRSPLFWTSVDGRGWRLIGAPTHWGLAGANGRQAVIFAPTNFGTVELGAWQSQDGRQWGQLLFTGDVADVPAFTAAVGQPNHVDQIFVASGGIVVIGQRGGHPAAWFATAVEP